MTDTNDSGKLSRRDAIVLFAGAPALGADAALTGVFGGTAGASLFFVGSAQACGSSASFPSSLASLAAEHFEPLVGQDFVVGEHRVTLRAVHRGPATSAEFREPFAVAFSLPQSASNAVSIASAPIGVGHPAIGRHDLLVTAVGTGAGRALEICFG